MSDATYIAKRIAELEAEVERLRQVIADEIAEHQATLPGNRAGNVFLSAPYIRQRIAALRKRAGR